MVQRAGNVAVPEGLEMVRAGGRYLSIGEGGGTHDIGVSPRAVSVKMLNIIGVRSGAGRHFWEALQCLKQGKFLFGVLMTGTYALDNVADAFIGMKAMTEVKAAFSPIPSCNRNANVAYGRNKLSSRSY